MSLNAFSASISFEKMGTNLETEACYAAATDGIRAAKTVVRAQGVNYIELSSTLLCNGMKITDFANKYAKLRKQNQANATVKLVALSAMDRSVESRLCLDAVTMGETAARQKHNMRNASIQCNGKEISVFLKTLKNVKVVEQESTKVAAL